MQACADWFSSLNGDGKRVLVFNCQGGRDIAALLAPLRKLAFTDVYFVPNVSRSGDMANKMVHRDQSLKHQYAIKQAWQGEAQVCSTIDEALAQIQDGQVLVTGSLHLIGAVMLNLKIPVE